MGESLRGSRGGIERGEEGAGEDGEKRAGGALSFQNLEKGGGSRGELLG